MTVAVCVYCASANNIPESYFALARDVGAEIAKRGHTLVSGGGCVSMMGEVATAARAGGARTVGVIPRLLLDQEVGDPEADELVIVETMRERKAEMEARADGFLTLPGGLGTLEELLEIWSGRALAFHDKPVVVLDPDGVYDGLWDFIKDLMVKGFVRETAFSAISVVRTVPEAIDAATATISR